MENDALRELKQAFFAYRNGVVADRLRRAGDPHEFIMGCLLADLRQTVRPYSPNEALADALWAARRHRECRLAAPLVHPEVMSRDKALSWCCDVQCAEEADVLCHGLLRRQSYAEELSRQLMDATDAWCNYVGYRLLLNLLVLHRIEPTSALRAQMTALLQHPAPHLEPLLRAIVEELDDFSGVTN